MKHFGIAVVALGAGLISSAASAGVIYSGSLTTPASGGVVGGGSYSHVPPPANAEGFTIAWEVSQNMDGTWHYEYTMLDAAGGNLNPAVSHAIFQLSENITPGDLFNFGGNNQQITYGTFGPAPSNPGIPGSIFGIKIDTDGMSPTVLSFDSNRQPMWGDFYTKGGSSSFAYNVSFGVAVANLNDYANPPVDASGAPLFKILVPDTIIPTPGSIALVGFAGLAMARRRR